MVARPASVTVTPPAIDRMRRLAKAALVVLTGFLLSRLLGAVRNIVIAAHFGTGTEYAAYVAAITLPDLVFQVLVGGAVGSAFIATTASVRPERMSYGCDPGSRAWYRTVSFNAVASPRPRVKA